MDESDCAIYDTLHIIHGSEGKNREKQILTMVD